MKMRVFSAAVVAGVISGVFGFPQVASAVTTVAIANEDTTGLPGIGQIIVPTPTSSSNTLVGISGLSSPGEYRNPFEDFTTHIIAAGYEKAPFTAIGSSAGGGTALYDFASPQSLLVALLGSPDSYNSIDFYSSTGGGGTNVGHFTGSDFSIATFGHDLVTFIASGGTFQSLVLSSAHAALEFAAVETRNEIPTTPIPGTLPLFATGLGVFGYLARRRKKRDQAPGATLARATTA